MAISRAERGAHPRSFPVPRPPSTTLHLNVAGHVFVLNPGEAHPITLHRGDTIPITVSIVSPTGAPVTDVYLTVNSCPSGIAAGRPTGKVKILAHHEGLLRADESLTAAWIAETLFNTDRLMLALDYSVGDHGLGLVVANMTVA